MAIRVTQDAVEAALTQNPKARVTQDALEVATTENPKARVTQDAIEVAVTALAKARVSQVAIEVIEALAPPTHARITQDAVEIATTEVAKARITQAAIEAFLVQSAQVLTTQIAIEVIQRNFYWSIDGAGGCEWTTADLSSTWRIDGGATLSFEGTPISLWVIQGRGELAFVASTGGRVSSWAIDGVATVNWTGGLTNRATWRIDGAATVEWIVRGGAALEKCLTDDGELPQAPGRGSNYVF